MINLLSEEAKKDIRASRTNVKLLNYIIILGIGVAFLVLISVGVYFILLNTQSSAQELISLNQSKSTSYTSVEAQGNALRTQLSSAKTILDQEIVYTHLITGIATLMPSGTVLDTLTLSPSTIGGPVTMQFYADNDPDALTLKNNFQTSPLFSNVSFTTLSSTGGINNYPVNLSLSLTINKSAIQ